jgi:hypothetical protein
MLLRQGPGVQRGGQQHESAAAAACWLGLTAATTAAKAGRIGLVSALVVGRCVGCLPAGAGMVGASQPTPEPEIRTVTQVSERPVWTPECEEIPNQSERRQCEGIMAGYYRSLQPATTTTVAPTTATTRRPRPATTTTRRPRPATTRPPAQNCHPSYPDFCIPPPPPDLDCEDVNGSDFTVLPPDPHRFDREGDGLGCES